MFLSHRSEPIRQRRCAAGDVGQSFDHSIELESPIESIGKFAQVPPQMLPMNRMVGPMNRIFDVAEHGVDPGEGLDLHAGRAATGDNAPVRTGLDDRPEALQSVGSHFSIRRQVLTRPPVNRVAAKALQRRHPHGQRPTIRAARHGGDKRRLTGRTATALATHSLAAPEGIIDLDRAGQGLGIVALAHRLHQLVLDQPGGLVGHPEVTRQRQRRESGLALREQENRQKPSGQRQFGLLEQRSRRQRGLVMAAMALKHLSRLQFAEGGIATLRAAEALRPTQLEQRLAAGVFRSVFFEKLRQTEPFLKLNRIPSHFVTSCIFDSYEISKRLSQ